MNSEPTYNENVRIKDIKSRWDTFKTLFIGELVYQGRCQGIKFTVCIFSCPSLRDSEGRAGGKWNEMRSYNRFSGVSLPCFAQPLTFSKTLSSNFYLGCVQVLSHWHSLGPSSVIGHVCSFWSSSPCGCIGFHKAHPVNTTHKCY